MPLIGDCVEMLCAPIGLRPAHARKPGPLLPSTRSSALLSPLRMGLRRVALIAGSLLAAPFLIVLSGCGTAAATANSANATFAISPGMAILDTNCTGCNAGDAHGLPVHRLTAALAKGSTAQVSWSVSGGDAMAGPGRISAAGEYTPPSYLTTDRAQVVGDGPAGRRSAHHGERPDHR